MKRIIRRTTAIFSITVAAIVFAVAFLPLRAIAGLESPCTYISDLISTNPLSSDLASTGDDHHRCIKVALKTTFPNINGAVTSTDEELNIVDGVTSTAAELNLLDGITGTVWSSGNDGAGSTLDADLLDTFSSAAFARLAIESIFTSAGSGTTGTIRLSSAAPILRFDDTDASADNGIWDFQVSGNNLFGTARNDAGSLSSDWLLVTGNGSGITSINLTATAVQANGVSVARAVTANVRLAAARQTNTAGSCTISENYGITSCTWNSTGSYAVNLTAAGFTVAPVCVASSSLTTGDIANTSSPSSTAVTVTTRTNAGTLVDSAWSLQCMGP